MIYEPEIQTLVDLVAVQARRRPNETALTCDGRSLTYAQLHARAAEVGSVLRERGIGQGHSVAVLSKESVESILVIFGAAWCGAVVVPINWRLSPREIAHVLTDSGCTAIYVGDDLRPAAEQAVERATTWILDAHSLGASAPAADPAPVTVRDVAVRLYTSGTTGKPKGVDLPHESFFAIAREFHRENRRWIGSTPGEVALCVLPTFHVGGMWWLVRVLASGGHAVVLPQFAAWKAIEAIERYRVRTAAVVPAMLHVMLSEPDASVERFASLRVIGYGGSPMPPALLDRAMSVFRCEFHQVYGLTETGNMAVWLSAEDHAHPTRRRAAGRPLPGVSAKIIDPDGRPLPPGQVGEVCLKSPAAMLGYWKNPGATEATLRDGWVHTGDAGRIDDEGYVYLTDRIKDMISCAGEKVWPAEVEGTLAACPGIREIAVIGVPHSEWGEVVKAIVVAAGANTVDLRSLRAFGRDRLAEFKLPIALEVVESLPRNAAGKVLKQLLRERHASAGAQASSSGR